MKISIIGGGIGGLTTAIALKNTGHDIIVYEVTQEIKPVGAGILLAHNAMQVFKKFGIAEKIERAGQAVYQLKIADQKLNTITTTNLRVFDEKFSVSNIAIHRAELLHILADEVGTGNIQLSKRLKTIERKENFQNHFRRQYFRNGRYSNRCRWHKLGSEETIVSIYLT